MQLFIIICVYAGIVLLSWSITRWVRQYALDKMLLDHPNHRSLHTSPTPRGGGLSIVLPVLSAILVLWVAGYLPGQMAMASGGGGLLVALTGWLDDNLDVSIRIRIILYIIAAAWACYWIARVYEVNPLNQPVTYLLQVFAVTWVINLYNFMDGSDALATAQGIFTSIVTAVLLSLAGTNGLAIVLLIMAASCSGFMVWNWPPARIFMGDIGSCFIGFIFGTFAIITSYAGTLSLAIWMILLSVFICDASLTLLKRILAGAQWYRAHRSHAYQLLVQSGISHKRLIYIILATYVVLLLPMTWLAYHYERVQWGITLFVYCLAAGAWLKIQTGTGQSGKSTYETSTDS